MLHLKSTHSAFYIIPVLTFFCCSLFISGVTFAAPRSDGTYPEFMPRGYLNGVVDGNQLVIDDRQFVVDDNSIYYNKEGRRISLRSFSDGDIVRYKADANKLIKILKQEGRFDLEGAPQAGSGAESTPSNQGGEGMHFENGVWHN